MGELAYDEVEGDFSSWNLARDSVFVSEDRLFLVLPSGETDPFRRGVTLTISAVNVRPLYKDLARSCRAERRRAAAQAS